MEDEKQVSTFGGGAPKDTAPREEGGGMEGARTKAVEAAPENKAVQPSENK